MTTAPRSYAIWHETWTDDGVRRRTERTVVCDSPATAAAWATREIDRAVATYGAERCRAGSYEVELHVRIDRRGGRVVGSRAAG